jgi:hypothetical protein
MRLRERTRSYSSAASLPSGSTSALALARTARTIGSALGGELQADARRRTHSSVRWVPRVRQKQPQPLLQLGPAGLVGGDVLLLYQPGDHRRQRGTRRLPGLLNRLVLSLLLGLLGRRVLDRRPRGDQPARRSRSRLSSTLG